MRLGTRLTYPMTREQKYNFPAPKREKCIYALLSMSISSPGINSVFHLSHTRWVGTIRSQSCPSGSSAVRVTSRCCSIFRETCWRIGETLQYRRKEDRFLAESVHGLLPRFSPCLEKLPWEYLYDNRPSLSWPVPCKLGLSIEETALAGCTDILYIQMQKNKQTAYDSPETAPIICMLAVTFRKVGFVKVCSHDIVYL